MEFTAPDRVRRFPMSQQHITSQQNYGAVNRGTSFVKLPVSGAPLPPIPFVRPRKFPDRAATRGLISRDHPLRYTAPRTNLQDATQNVQALRFVVR